MSSAPPFSYRATCASVPRQRPSTSLRNSRRAISRRPTPWRPFSRRCRSSSSSSFCAWPPAPDRAQPDHVDHSRGPDQTPFGPGCRRPRVADCRGRRLFVLLGASGSGRAPCSLIAASPPDEVPCARLEDVTALPPRSEASVMFSELLDLPPHDRRGEHRLRPQSPPVPREKRRQR